LALWICFVRRELVTALSQWARGFRARRDGSATALVGSLICVCQGCVRGLPLRVIGS
jgi:hypothetical protein